MGLLFQLFPKLCHNTQFVENKYLKIHYYLWSFSNILFNFNIYISTKIYQLFCKYWQVIIIFSNAINWIRPAYSNKELLATLTSEIIFDFLTM